MVISALPKTFFVLATLVVSAFSSLAAGQQPRIAVITQDNTALRAGDMLRFYRVADLKSGAIVEVIGESNGWAKVVYPKNINAYVEADRVEKVNDTTLRLTKESALLAPSELLGASGSWCALFESPLPVGTTLELKEEVAGIGGKISKYLVAAPRPPLVPTQPRGFVPLTSLRDATPDEVASYLGTTGASIPSPAPVEDPAPEASNPSENDGSGESSQTPANQDPAVSDPIDLTLIQPIRTEPLPPAVQVPTIVPQADPTAPGPSVPVPAEAPSGQQLVAMTVNQLNASFDQLRAMPRDKMDAGLEEMLAECRRSAEAVGGDPALVAGINQRIAWLELRMKLRDQRLELERALQDADQRQATNAERVKKWQDQRAYTLIGRVLASTLYDGTRLPLMYRIESIDGVGLQRTIGYIQPTDKIDPGRFLGGIVGVIGQTRFDNALGVRIVVPSRVDMLEMP